MAAGDRIIDFFVVCGLGPDIQSLSGEAGYKCATTEWVCSESRYTKQANEGSPIFKPADSPRLPRPQGAQG